MNNKEALIADIEPYTPSGLTIQKALMDNGLTAEDTYVADNKKDIAKAAICVLRKLIVLSSESIGKSSQSYNVAELERRIKGIIKENGLNAEDYSEPSSITDGSQFW